MPEFGMMFKFNADYDNVEWYGLGDQETYADRNRGAKLGIYKNKVADNMAKYLVPQECGNKIGVRYAKVTDMKGRGILFEGDDLSFSALPYTPHEIWLYGWSNSGACGNRSFGSSKIRCECVKENKFCNV